MAAFRGEIVARLGVLASWKTIFLAEEPVLISLDPSFDIEALQYHEICRAIIYFRAEKFVDVEPKRVSVT